MAISYTQLPGLAADIGVGPNGEVWVTGTNQVPGGYGVFYWDGSAFQAYSGGAVRIAVGPNNTPWVVNNTGNIFQANGAGGWNQLPGLATDIGAGASGEDLWVTGTNSVPGGFGVFQWDGSAFQSVGGGAVNISVGPNHTDLVIALVNNENSIFLGFPGTVSVQDVDLALYLYSGGGNINDWITQACQAAGLPVNAAWMNGFLTLCQRESSYNPNAVNTTDGNATGPIVADGHPQNCSRGVAQCVPSTFAAYHVAGTSVAIYDPVANIAAASQYIRAVYQVSLDGSDFAAKVEQADPNRPPHGYIVLQ